jgi:hypothetical protein
MEQRFKDQTAELRKLMGKRRPPTQAQTLRAIAPICMQQLGGLLNDQQADHAIWQATMALFAGVPLN